MEVSAGWGKDVPTTPTHRHFYYLSATNNDRSSDMQEFVLDIPEELSTYLIGIDPSHVDNIRILVLCEGKRAWDGSLGLAEMWIRSIGIYEK
jgi:hypothetical protein